MFVEPVKSVTIASERKRKSDKHVCGFRMLCYTFTYSNNITPTLRLYSNSKINVDRLNMSPNKHKLNLARKLLKILRVVNSHDASVYHIPGNNNPADQFSRPANPSTFVASNPWTLDLSCLPSDLAAITIEPQGVPIDSSSTLLDSYSSLDRMIWSHRPYSFVDFSYSSGT